MEGETLLEVHCMRLSLDRETEKAGMKGRDSVLSVAMAEEVMVQLTELLKEVEREQEL